MAGSYLLGANVLSETRKPRADAGVLAFLAGLDSAGLFISALTLGELRKGVAAKRRIDPPAARDIESWVDGIETGFADRVLPVDAATARIWANCHRAEAFP